MDEMRKYLDEMKKYIDEMKTYLDEMRKYLDEMKMYLAEMKRLGMKPCFSVELCLSGRSHLELSIESVTLGSGEILDVILLPPVFTLRQTVAKPSLIGHKSGSESRSA